MQSERFVLTAAKRYFCGLTSCLLVVGTAVNVTVAEHKSFFRVRSGNGIKKRRKFHDDEDEMMFYLINFHQHFFFSGSTSVQIEIEPICYTVNCATTVDVKQVLNPDTGHGTLVLAPFLNILSSVTVCTGVMLLFSPGSPAPLFYSSAMNQHRQHLLPT